MLQWSKLDDRVPLSVSVAQVNAKTDVIESATRHAHNSQEQQNNRQIRFEMIRHQADHTEIGDPIGALGLDRVLRMLGEFSGNESCVRESHHSIADLEKSR